MDTFKLSKLKPGLDLKESGFYSATVEVATIHI